MFCRSRVRKVTFKYSTGSIICLFLTLMFFTELSAGTAAQAQGQPTGTPKLSVTESSQEQTDFFTACSRRVQTGKIDRHC